jgi:hypothetical protein
MVAYLEEPFAMRDKTFEGFCHHMYLRNCDERESYGEKRYTYEEYIISAKGFLKQKYKEQ